MARPKKDHISSAEREKMMMEKAERLGMSPEKLAELAIVAELMKAPSELEQKKADEEQERLRQNLLAQAELERNKAKNLEHSQKYCPHRREDGMLLFTGQVLSNGIALVHCLRCQKPHAWMASEDEKRQGLNFMDKHNLRAVDESQLIAQERLFPVPPEKLRAIGKPALAAIHEQYFAEKKELAHV